jgi:hypothetical protein
MCLWSQTACEKPKYVVGDFCGLAVDAFTQQRVLKLRDEIALLRHENEVYRSQRRRTREEEHSNDSRRFRLLGSVRNSERFCSRREMPSLICCKISITVRRAKPAGSRGWKIPESECNPHLSSPRHMHVRGSHPCKGRKARAPGRNSVSSMFRIRRWSLSCGPLSRFGEA